MFEFGECLKYVSVIRARNIQRGWPEKTTFGVLTFSQERTPNDYEPNGPGANRSEVEQKNKEARANQTHISAPVDGSNNEGFKAPPKEKEPKQQIAKPTFAWRNIGAWDNENSADKEKELKRVKAIEGYVVDHFYGDWYWNTILPIGVCFFAYLFARIGFSFLWLPIVLLCASSVYRAEYRRFNRDVRDDMARINAANRLEEELETMEWLNSFLAKFWVIYMPALSEMVMFQANEVLKDSAPGFGIEALSLDEFTLGSKSPRVDSIKSYTRKGNDHIEMDWAFSFTPNDTDDMTKNEIKKKLNPKVALGVTVGKAFISKSLPILVEDMSFTGRMNIKLKLNESFPHVKMVSVQFLEPPVIDYALKPVGGDTFGLDIMTFIPGLSSFVNGLIHFTLRPMLYAPNSLDIDVEDIMSQQSNDSIGVVAVRIKRVINLKSTTEIKNNEFHPYVQIGVANNAAIKEKTKVKKNTTDPVFLETKYILVNSLESNQLTLNVFHMVPDKVDDLSLGITRVQLVDLLQNDVQTDLSKNILESGKVVGKIEFDLKWYPALRNQVLDDGTKEENIDAEVGIMKLSVYSAEDLDLSQSVVGILNPYAEVYVNNELIKTSRRLRQNNEPAFGVTFESLVTQQSQTQIQVLVKDSAEDTIVGRLDTNLQDLIFESSRGQQWISAPPVRPGGHPAKFRIGAKWKALGMEDEDIEIQNNAPIGGLRLHIRGANGLVNLESVGDVDPYVRVVQNGRLKAKTPIIANTSNPIFRNVFYLPVSNEHQHILLDILDAETEGKDRPLGSCAITVRDFLKKNEEGYYLGYDGSEEIIEQPVLYNGKSYGTMTYSVSFFPNIPVYTHTQMTHLDEYLEHKKQKELEEKRQAEREEKLFKEHPDQYEWVEMQDDIIGDTPRVEMPLETAIEYRSGVILVHILKGQFNKPDYYVHTLFDDQAYPSSVTSKCETRTLTTSSTAEAFMRDLPNSKIVFRITHKAEVQDQREVVAEKVFDTIELLKRSYSKPFTASIDRGNHLTFRMEFIPSAAKLAPLDTVLDVGYVKLDILSAENLMSVDRNGKSDPLCVVKLDGVQIYKTDKRRRTLDPLWNEAVEFPMLSRSRDILLLEVYDWDLTHEDELIGRANVDLSTITPNLSTQFKVELDTQGVVTLRATFKPEFIRPKLSKSRGLPVDMADVAGVPLKVVGGAAGLAGNVVGGGVGLMSDGVTKGGSFLRKGFRGMRNSKDDERSEFDLSHNGHRNGGSHDTAESMLTSDQASEFTISTSQTHPSKKGKVRSSSSRFEDNRRGAPPPEEQMQNNRPPSIKNAVPNLDPDFLPPPQRPSDKGHRRGVSQSTDISTIYSGMFGPEGIPGRVNIVSATGFNGSLEVRATLSTPSKTKDIYKTRPAKSILGNYEWKETFVFKSPPDGLLLFLVKEHHKFGRNQTLGSAEIALSDYLNTDGLVVLSVGDGELKINLRYVSA